MGSEVKGGNSNPLSYCKQHSSVNNTEPLSTRSSACVPVPGTQVAAAIASVLGELVDGDKSEGDGAAGEAAPFEMPLALDNPAELARDLHPITAEQKVGRALECNDAQPLQRSHTRAAVTVLYFVCLCCPGPCDLT